MAQRIQDRLACKKLEKEVLDRCAIDTEFERRVLTYLRRSFPREKPCSSVKKYIRHVRSVLKKRQLKPLTKTYKRCLVVRERGFRLPAKAACFLDYVIA